MQTGICVTAANCIFISSILILTSSKVFLSKNMKIFSFKSLIKRKSVSSLYSYLCCFEKDISVVEKQIVLIFNAIRILYPEKSAIIIFNAAVRNVSPKVNPLDPSLSLDNCIIIGISWLVEEAEMNQKVANDCSSFVESFADVVKSSYLKESDAHFNKLRWDEIPHVNFQKDLVFCVFINCFEKVELKNVVVFHLRLLIVHRFEDHVLKFLQYHLVNQIRLYVKLYVYFCLPLVLLVLIFLVSLIMFKNILFFLFVGEMLKIFLVFHVKLFVELWIVLVLQTVRHQGLNMVLKKFSFLVYFCFSSLMVIAVLFRSIGESSILS